jgi:hypothetical protein
MDAQTLLGDESGSLCFNVYFSTIFGICDFLYKNLWAVEPWFPWYFPPGPKNRFPHLLGLFLRFSGRLFCPSGKIPGFQHPWSCYISFILKDVGGTKVCFQREIQSREVIEVGGSFGLFFRA